MYVAIEGIDTAGKSTQIAMLKQKYPEAIFTLEPGGSELGKKIREVLLESEMSLSAQAEFLLFLCDRAEHIQKVIKPNMNQLIFSDRSLISGIAYAKEMTMQKSIELNLFATEGIKPDIVVVLELCKEELHKRLSSKKQDKIELRGIEYLLEIQQRMIEISQRLGVKLLRIDAGLSKEEIFKQLCANLS